MKTAYEYEATRSVFVFEEGEPVRPIEPDGEDWELVSSIVVEDNGGRIGVVWYWRRETARL